MSCAISMIWFDTMYRIALTVSLILLIIFWFIFMPSVYFITMNYQFYSFFWNILNLIIMTRPMKFLDEHCLIRVLSVTSVNRNTREMVFPVKCFRIPGTLHMSNKVVRLNWVWMMYVVIAHFISGSMSGIKQIKRSIEENLSMLLKFRIDCN